MCEVELIKKMQGGDSSAFEEIFHLYGQKAVRTAFFITGNRFLSEDVVQEAFILCYRKIGNLKNPELFKPWFFKIVTRLSWKYQSRGGKETPVRDIFERAEKALTGRDGSFEIFKKSEYEELYAAINKLDKKSKTIIILFYFNDFSIKEISRIMDCFQGTVKSRLFNSRKKLKKYLKDSYEEGEKDEKFRAAGQRI